MQWWLLTSCRSKNEKMTDEKWCQRGDEAATVSKNLQMIEKTTGGLKHSSNSENESNDDKLVYFYPVI